MKRRIPILIAILAVLAALITWACLRRASAIVLTGIVTTDEVIVSAEISGRLQEMLVQEGAAVTNGQLLAVIQPQEWKADVAYYAGAQSQSSALVAQAEADLKFQEAQTTNQILQAEADPRRDQSAGHPGGGRPGKRRSHFQARGGPFPARRGFAPDLRSSPHHLRGEQGAGGLAQQTGARRRGGGCPGQGQLRTDGGAPGRAPGQRRAAGRRQSPGGKGGRAPRPTPKFARPSPGLLTRARPCKGEVVNPAQAIVTLINPDDLWVRADVEESYIERIHLGDRLTVRLPSGAVREGVVFFRGIDADYATQRDVSRTKRDIKTFQVRLRCDNRDRSLAVGMTAYVTLPLATR